jgi:hypothetical protein
MRDPCCSRLARMIDGEGICPVSSVFCRRPFRGLSLRATGLAIKR